MEIKKKNYSVCTELDARRREYAPTPPPLIFAPTRPQKMPENPKYDQFNWDKVVRQWRKSRDPGSNLISSEGGQDTSAYHISGHYTHVFSRKCMRNLKFDQFQ